MWIRGSYDIGKKKMTAPMINKPCDFCGSKENMVYPKYEVNSGMKIEGHFNGMNFIPKDLKYSCQKCFDKEAAARQALSEIKNEDIDESLLVATLNMKSANPGMKIKFYQSKFKAYDKIDLLSIEKVKDES